MANVKLISVTKGAGELEDKSCEELISYTARVSNPKNQENFDSAPKLLKFLMDHKHWSPLEMSDMTVEIVTSRAIAQQILRHRSFCFQEFSQRYAECQNFQTYEARRQDKKNRQNSIDDMSKDTKEWFTESQHMAQEFCMDLYKTALEKGIAKEQARFLLPLNTQTTMYMKGNARSWVHYIQLRTGNGTQKEHQEIAEMIKILFCEQFPCISRALGWID